MRLVWRRVAACLIDWLAILVWVGAVAAVGVPLYRAGLLQLSDQFLLNAMATLTVVVPVTIALAILETGPRAASIGKRVMRLRVVTAVGAEAPGFPRSLLRNSLKIALPWIIGHAAVYELVASGGRGGPALVLLVAAYVLPILYLVTLLAKLHLPSYDRLAGTRVVPAWGTDARTASRRR